MRALVILLFLSLSACKADIPVRADKPANSSKAGPVIEYPHFKRPNLVVADLDRSLKIYRDVLGFEAAAISESSADSFSYPVFNIPRDAKMRSVTLHEAGEARIIALTEVVGADMAPLPDAPHRTAHVIGVVDLPGKIEAIRAMGLEITNSKIAGGVDFEFIEQAFVDFDGHLIVLYEVLPKQ